MTDQQPAASFLDYLKALPQYLLPQHPISRFTRAVTRIRAPWFKGPFTRWFANHFQVDLSEAVETDIDAFEHFNAFFTRALKEGARPIAAGDDIVVSPVDGTVSQAGPIQANSILQAKGRDYSISELLGGCDDHVEQFIGGTFTTIYLSPSNYHRIHMPISGTLRDMIHIPGRLYSVSPATTRVIPRLFARNERVVALFETAVGPVAMVMVGALNVGSIETVWAGEVTPPQGRKTHQTHYEKGAHYDKGDEIARFNMGSTVILLFGKEQIEWMDEMQPNATMRMGRAIGTLTATHNDGD